MISFVINLVCASILRDRNRAAGSRYSAFRLPLLKKPEFLFLLGWGIFSMLGYVALLFSLPNYAVSLGLSSRQGSIVGALHNLGQGIGRPIVGLVGDRFGRINMASFLSFATCLLIFAIWIEARNIGILCFFAILSGTVSGTFWATVGPVLVEVIGLEDLPGGLVSEAIALQLRDLLPGKNTYLHPQIFTCCMPGDSKRLENKPGDTEEKLLP